MVHQTQEVLGRYINGYASLVVGFDTATPSLIGEFAKL